MRTERPASSDTRPPRLVPFGTWSRQTLAVAPQRNRGGPSGALASLSRIDALAFGGVFIESDEVTQRHGIGRVVGLGEWIESQRFFEASDEDGDGERVEA